MKKKKKSKKPSVQHQVEKKSLFTNTRLHLLIISIASFLLYANTFAHEYAQDDAIVITDNMYTQDGIKGIPGLLNKDTFFGFFKVEGKAALVAGGRYRPFSLITFAIEQEIFGSNPSISHIINAIFYALLCAMLYLFIVKAFSKTSVRKNLPLFALMVTLIFAFHPIHTEAVANIKGRDEILAFLLGISSIYMLMRDQFSKILKYLFSGILFFLAMMSKENAITLIPVAFLVFWYLKRDSFSSSVFKVLPPIIATILFLAIRFSILGFGTGNEPLEMMNNPFVKYANGSYAFFTASERMAAIIFALGWYLKLLILPHPLTNDYYPRSIEVITFSDPWVLISLISLIVLLGLTVFNWKRSRIISFSILYFVMTISIFSNIVFPIGTHLSERFLFMPSLAFCLLLGYGIFKLYEKYGKKVLIGSAVVVLGLYSVKTITRNMVWKNDYTLYTTDVKVSNNSAKALNAAGGVLVSNSVNITDQEVKNRSLNQAMEYLNRAISIHPNYKNAWLLLGNAHFYLNRFEDAINAYDRSLGIDPSYAEANKNLPFALREAGRYAGDVEGNLTKARNYLTRAYNMNPDDSETNRLMGILESFTGNHQNAVKYYTRVAQLTPNDKRGYVLLYQAYKDMGDEQNAEINRRKALQIDPNAFNQ